MQRLIAITYSEAKDLYELLNKTETKSKTPCLQKLETDLSKKFDLVRKEV